MSDVDCPLLQPHIARCKAGYVCSLLVWPRYGHVPDNELDSNELDWTGLVPKWCYSQTCIRGVWIQNLFLQSLGGQIPKNEASVRPLADSETHAKNLKLLCDRLEVGSICRLTAQFVDP